jgi:hypothetical protein
MRTAIKYLWALPMTAVGLVLVGLIRLTGGTSQVAEGTIEAWGGSIAKWIFQRALAGKAACMTVGHVIIALGEQYLARMRLHERVHVRQYEKWGALFVPLYLGSSFIAWMQGRNYYRDNVFEREAYKVQS